ncbi:hypothetical protein IEQ34_022680 [Dendrobium chrysotoxum]|uniref:Uncharacterized protein n=1 Tax=Dendrobium chrysotoxum TaxID=161865 RepID=A0AAV7FZQ6_DENCH|nr:hypothetical protein IEQ34_022680 [Dendrobium chrysotoxum]
MTHEEILRESSQVQVQGRHCVNGREQECSALIPVATYSGAAYPKVPITRVVTWESPPVGPFLASPKSESFGM